jgi:hypothetical protein
MDALRTTAKGLAHTLLLLGFMAVAMADPIGSRLSHTSDWIIVPDVGTLHWQIQSGMRVSWITIRN